LSKGLICYIENKLAARAKELKEQMENAEDGEVSIPMIRVYEVNERIKPTKMIPRPSSISTCGILRPTPQSWTSSSPSAVSKIPRT
jgi:hypothetical protein